MLQESSPAIAYPVREYQRCLGPLLLILRSQYILQGVCGFPVLLPISYVRGCGEQKELV